MDVFNKKVTVLGAARSGLAAAALLGRKGAKVYVSEQGGIEKFPSDFLSWARAAGVQIEVGGHTREFIAGSALVVPARGSLSWLRPWCGRGSRASKFGEKLNWRSIIVRHRLSP
ncbi:MAG TPA: hypothetical protein PLT76_04415 [Candidatus Omnitrophota bacterium]|nr:hypothetical protein [Candidatus Omnitrophota bacterium]